MRLMVCRPIARRAGLAYYLNTRLIKRKNVTINDQVGAPALGGGVGFFQEFCVLGPAAPWRPMGLGE